MKKFLLYIWQLPQNIVGLFVRLIYRVSNKMKAKGVGFKNGGIINFYYCPKFPGGISLGNYIIIGYPTAKTINHEFGHQIQSKYLGPLYLLVIGIPSIVWAGLYGRVIKRTVNGYYKFYTEKWADKLGNVSR